MKHVIILPNSIWIERIVFLRNCTVALIWLGSTNGLCSLAADSRAPIECACVRVVSIRFGYSIGSSSICTVFSPYWRFCFGWALQVANNGKRTTPTEQPNMKIKFEWEILWTIHMHAETAPNQALSRTHPHKQQRTSNWNLNSTNWIGTPTNESTI